MKKVTVALIAASVLVGSLYAGSNEMDHSKMMNQKGMDHSKMMNQKGMDHSKMNSNTNSSTSTFEKHQKILVPEYRGTANYGI